MRISSIIFGFMPVAVKRQAVKLRFGNSTNPRQLRSDARQQEGTGSATFFLAQKRTRIFHPSPDVNDGDFMNACYLVKKIF